MTSVRTAVFGTVLMIAGTWPAAGQTLFATADYRADQERWTDPAYYRHNTARELTDMQVDARYAEQGSGRDDYDIRSPYPYTTAREHYDAWLEAAGGGTRHTLETLPDWDGLWGGGASWLNGRNIQASTIAAALTPQFQEYYVQQVKAEAEGRHWWAASFCLPDGFVRGVQRSQQFIVRPGQVTIISDMLSSVQLRWLHTDGRGHASEEFQFPQWLGESIGFWDGDALVVHTNQIRQWNATHSMFEWSDRLETVERYQRVGDAIRAELTLYDPVAFSGAAPCRSRFRARDESRHPAGLQHLHRHERTRRQHFRHRGRDARRTHPGHPRLLGSDRSQALGGALRPRRELMRYIARERRTP